MNSKRRFINVNYTMSYEEYDEGFTMPEFHFHNDYEIYILERGTRIVSIGDEELVTGAGDVVLFASEMPHKSRGKEGFSGICIHFSERYLKRYFTNIAIDRVKEVFGAKKVHVSTENIAVIKQMTDEFVIDDEDNFFKLAKVFEILKAELKTDLMEACVDAFTGTLKGHIAESKKKADEVFDYVDENYAYIKSVAELSEHFEVSESYLFRIFKSKYSMTLKTYINKLRIKNICNRLKYSERAIKALAAEYGFESYEHFCRVFKKEMGCTPTEYREKFCKSH